MSVAAAPVQMTCPACGFRSQPDHVPRGRLTFLTCSSCGMVVSARSGELAAAPRPPSAASGDEAATARIATGMIGHLILADDSALLRDAAMKALPQTRAGVGVETVADGFELLTRFVASHREGAPPSAIVMDVTMPIIDGKNAALMLRAIEDAFGKPPTPIIFFTLKPHDEGFQRLIDYLGVARHVAKTEGASPEELATSLATAVTS